jgi:hypothetical protein
MRARKSSNQALVRASKAARAVHSVAQEFQELQVLSTIPVATRKC